MLYISLTHVFVLLQNYFHFQKVAVFCDLTNKRCRKKRNIEARSRNHCCRGKAKRVTNSECVSRALVIHKAVCMFLRHFILSPVSCLAVQYFCYHLINGTIFEKKKVTECTTRVVTFHTTFV